MLMVAMGFVVAVSITGTVMLSLSYVHQQQMGAKALAVRAMAAAEAGIEAKRGRFTLIAGVQDDWSALLPTTGWNNIDGPLLINNLSVQVQARPTGSPSTPKVRIRGLVVTLGRTLAVEYEAKCPQQSDYSVFSGSTSTYNPGYNYKCVGNHYSQGSIFINSAYTGVEFFGRTETSGTITSYGAEGASYNFKTSPITNVAVRQVDFSAVNFTVPRTRAIACGMLYKENTLDIRLNGNNTFTRTYVRRRATAAARNTNFSPSTGWINQTTGGILTGAYYNTGGAGPFGGIYPAADNTRGLARQDYSSGVAITDYDVATEVVTLVPEAVIFIEEGTAGAADVESGAPIGTLNNYVQPLHTTTRLDNQPNPLAGRIGATAGISYFTQGFTSGGGTQQRKLCMFSGTVGTAESVTFVTANNIATVVRDCVKYQYLLNNPQYRNANNKTSAAAQNFTEICGVISATDINFAWCWWSPLTAAQECPIGPGGGTSSVSLGQPGQFALDCNFAAVNCSLPGSLGTGYPVGNGSGCEFWFCGGNSGNQLINSGFGNIFSPPTGLSYGARHYDWDWRLNNTAPPYFLRTYNVSARFIPGTWRSYEF
jgi:hypothetical protein